MSLYSSEIGTSAMAEALSIISRVIFPLSSASPHSTPGKSVVVKPSREQAERKLRRSSMRSPLVHLKLARHYKPERRARLLCNSEVLTSSHEHEPCLPALIRPRTAGRAGTHAGVLCADSHDIFRTHCARRCE